MLSTSHVLITHGIHHQSIKLRPCVGGQDTHFGSGFSVASNSNGSVKARCVRDTRRSYCDWKSVNGKSSIGPTTVKPSTRIRSDHFRAQPVNFHLRAYSNINPFLSVGVHPFRTPLTAVEIVMCVCSDMEHQCGTTTEWIYWMYWSHSPIYWWNTRYIVLRANTFRK